MRTLTVIILAFISLTLCNSQVLVSENKLWSTVEYGTEQPDHYNYHSYWIKFQGDSLIYRTLYKRMFRSDDSTHSQWISYGFMREDSLQRVYAYAVPNRYFPAGEVLLYDFNLKKGDSISMGKGHYLPVDSVGYITLENKPYKIIYMAHASIKWIEGIGSTMGILWGIPIMFLDGLDRYLVCYSENDSLIYHNQNYNSCYVNHIALGIQLPNVQNISIRLTNDNNEVFLVFSGALDSYKKLSLYDITGKVLYRGNFNSTRINLSELKLPSGIYVFEAVIKNQRYCGKVIL